MLSPYTMGRATSRPNSPWAAMGMVGLIGSGLLLIAASLVPPEDGSGMYLRVIGFVGLVASSAMQMRTVARVLQRRSPDDLG